MTTGDPGIGFTTIGSEPSSDMAIVGVGATATFESGISAFFEYQGGSGYSSHIIQAGARVRFLEFSRADVRRLESVTKTQIKG